ncbi:MAG: acyltransferase family protein [Anaerolineae bacterium]|nr:acyltransferase family protein [Anaerolineae bacterium]
MPTHESVTSNPQSNKPARRHDIDWLRVLAVLLLIIFHTARIFDIWEPFYAKNSQTSVSLTYLFISSIFVWHMPLFFLLAGASTWFALQFRSGQQYALERFKRLLLPFIFGLLALAPPQAYVGALTYGYFEGSFFEYYPLFFQIGPTGDLTGYMGGFTPGHLWFILFLFVLALAGLPLFLWLKQESGRRQINRLANFFAHPGMIYLPALPLVVTLALPDLGGKNPFYYFVFFTYGYVLMADARFKQIVARHKGLALLLGPVALVAVLMAEILLGPSTGWLNLAANIYFPTMGSWCCLIALLGYGQKYLNFTNRFLQYAGEGAYAFYILHQTVIIVIGYYVTQWDLGVWPKFLIIVVAALLATTLVYDLLVRRANMTRFLFGMKPRPKGSIRPAIGHPAPANLGDIASPKL